ncbi:hypothetical protein [Stutzerimonas nitrititolerans]|uniref:hypothetical protein n=1 Tax=Stutzerimonas nitrititolerans TaxID=2482751 RepID=UPI0028AF7C44|nr:hypothetical protein [Stutzerimonas nitrititolerans]
MTEHAGEVEQGLLWKQEHLAPMPIPTGQPASDLMNIIWRKNEVYLDIGSFAMAAGWLTLHMGTVLFAAISVWVVCEISGIQGMTWIDFLGIPILGGQ